MVNHTEMTEVSFFISIAANLLVADFLIACVPTLLLLSKNHPFPDFFLLRVGCVCTKANYLKVEFAISK